MLMSCPLRTFLVLFLAQQFGISPSGGFCRAGRGEEKQVGKTDTRVIDESFISQNKLLELHSKWLVLRQKGTGWQAGWEEPARQLRSALALSDLS